MELTLLGHSCVLVASGALILIDPGENSMVDTHWAAANVIDAIAITHEHRDHLDTEAIGRIRHLHPDVIVVAHPVVAQLLPGIHVRTVEPGDSVLVRNTQMQVGGGIHADVFPGVPGIANLTYTIDGFYHPGDSLDIPAGDVAALALPVAGPWLKLGDAAQFLAAVAPRVAIPIHMGDVVDPAHSLDILQAAVPDGTVLARPAAGVRFTV